ncbi:MAG: acyltransferase [Nostocales cyanobacterium 94392]|nr:acyltransferase [Nostocales cyanobacterium 94392]
MIYKLIYQIKTKLNHYYNKYEKLYKQDIFRKEMGSFGKDCYIAKKAFLKSPLNKLFLGDGVFVEDYSTLECCLDTSAIHIGDRSIIRTFSRLTSGYGKIKIGNDCSVNPYTILFGNGDLIIGNWVRIATHVVINPGNHLYDDIDTPIDLQPLTNKGVVIEDDVWIGAGVIILEGCTIGKGSVIGAGTVVTKSIEPYSVVVGVPGRVIKKRGETKQNKLISLINEAGDI